MASFSTPINSELLAGLRALDGGGGVETVRLDTREIPPFPPRCSLGNFGPIDFQLNVRGTTSIIFSFFPSLVLG